MTPIPAHGAAPTSGASGVVVLAEDDVDHAFLVSRRLREQLMPDLDVVHVANMAGAVARLGEGDVRCVVLDLSLPDAQGLDAVRAIRAADPSVPIVVLTGTDINELGRQAVQLGAQDYLVKGRHGPDALGRSVVFAVERTKRQASEQQQALLASRLQLVLEASAEGICMVDGRGVVSFANHAAADLLGASAEELVGRSLHDFHLCPETDCSLEQRLLSGEPHDAGEQRFRSLQGLTRLLEVRGRPLPELAPAGGSVVNLTDVTARRLAEDALAEREAQLVDAQRLAHIGSWEWDLASDEVLWSDEMYRISGITPGSVSPDPGAFDAYLELVPPADRASLEPLFTGWDADHAPVTITHRLIRPDGRSRWLQCRASVSDASGPDDEGVRVVGTVQDITEQKVAEETLAHQALHDGLTGLPNRVLLLDRLSNALGDPRRPTVAVAFLDLDRFKWVNDSLSHAAGDELLVLVARRLTSVLRPTDTVARLGGDEFVVVCRELASEEQMFDVVARITAEFDRPFLVEGRELAITTSIGLAIAPPTIDIDSESLIRDADTALYRAKESGRARCEIFDEAMRHRAGQRLEVLTDLPVALDRDEFKAWYQPIVNLGTGRVVGCEALARWEHPVKGLLMPDAFIQHAEERGDIVTLGGAVLAQACEQVARWNRHRSAEEALTVSVNLSARQLGSDQLVQTVRTTLECSGLRPQDLCLEVTESVVMDDVAVSGAVLGHLRDLGIRTAIDDFGTGYSSLAYLLSLPIDVLKIDRSFVLSLARDNAPAVAIVEAITALASALGLGVVAEGVETPAQLAQLKELGVQDGQGYLWSRAVPAPQSMWAEPAQVVLPGRLDVPCPRSRSVVPR